MCPSRITTPTKNRATTTTTPNIQPRHHRHPAHHPKQNTLWNFIYAKLPAGSAPTDTPEILIPPETTPDPVDLTPPVQLPQQEEPTVLQSAHQSSLLQNKTNDPWGDADEYYKTHDCFRVLSKNVSTLNPQSLDMTAMAIELQHSNASVFLAQETNTAWLPPALRSTHAQCNKVHRHIKIATSSSQDNTDAKHHPGGTMTVALHKWASRVIGSGSDELLGRWSYLEFVGQGDKRLIVASAYRVCPQPFDATSMTATAQQTRLLLQHGVPQPNPRQQFVTDIISQVRQWRDQKKEVLLGMDANENVDDPNSKIARLFDETDLIDLHQHRHPAKTKPATFQQGSHPIDIMLGSPLVAQALITAWILPFGEPPMIKGDHRLLGPRHVEYSPSYVSTMQH